MAANSLLWGRVFICWQQVQAVTAACPTRCCLLRARIRLRTTSVGPRTASNYVPTGAGGVFTISSDYSCAQNTQVYLYTVSGDPGLGTGTNNAISMMAALGNCPSGGSFLSSYPQVVVNEVSTIAAAYSFAGFATDPLHVSSPNTSLALTGIKNAFANAANLAALGSGSALATTPSGGIAPQGTVYTLANILGACVNSNGATTGPTNPTGCYTLFTNATSDGTPTGAQPSDTATAAINIAHHAGANIVYLWGLVPAVPAFGSGLILEPNDFTLGIQYTSGGVNAPNFIAIDDIGNAWGSPTAGLPQSPSFPATEREDISGRRLHGRQHRWSVERRDRSFRQCLHRK